MQDDFKLILHIGTQTDPWMIQVDVALYGTSVEQ